MSAYHRDPLTRAAIAKAIRRHATPGVPFVKVPVIAQRVGLSPSQTGRALRSMMEDDYKYYGKVVGSLQGHGYGMFKAC